MNIRDKIADVVADAPTEMSAYELASTVLDTIRDNVPPLVWDEYRASGILDYDVDVNGDGYWYFSVNEDDSISPDCHTEEDAKDAANEHHVAQLMKGLGFVWPEDQTNV